MDRTTTARPEMFCAFYEPIIGTRYYQVANGSKAFLINICRRSAHSVASVLRSGERTALR